VNRCESEFEFSNCFQPQNSKRYAMSASQ